MQSIATPSAPFSRFSCKKFWPILAAAVAIALPASFAQGSVQLIASWDFNDTAGFGTTDGDGNTFASNLGTGVMETFNTSGVAGTHLNLQSPGTTVNAWEDAAAGNYLNFQRGSRWNNGGFELSFSTSGLTDVDVSFAATYVSDDSTATGANQVQASYSLNAGATFTDFGGLVSVTRDTWTALSFDFGDLLDNQSNVIVRYTLSGGSGTNTPGAFRLDNVNATAIPEPASAALLGAGLVLMITLMQRRRRGA